MYVNESIFLWGCEHAMILYSVSKRKTGISFTTIQRHRGSSLTCTLGKRLWKGQARPPSCSLSHSQGCRQVMCISVSTYLLKCSVLMSCATSRSLCSAFHPEYGHRGGGTCLIHKKLGAPSGGSGGGRPGDCGRPWESSDPEIWVLERLSGASDTNTENSFLHFPTELLTALGGASIANMGSLGYWVHRHWVFRILVFTIVYHFWIQKRRSLKNTIRKEKRLV